MFDKLLTKLKVKSSEFIRKHSSGLARTIFILVVALICFIPLYIGLLFWWLISPSGFWSVFATSVSAADYDLVGNGRYGNFDVRSGKNEESVEVRLTKINTILLLQ